MEDALTCDVCAEKFSAGEREPLVLQCGHSFCKPCLTNLSKKKDFSCPSCRRSEDDVDVDSLPVNFKLLGLVAEPAEPVYETCKEHKDEKTYWCKTCQLPLCCFCIYMDHPREHELVKGKDFLKEKQSILESQFQKWKQEIEINNACKLNLILRELKNFYISEANFAETKRKIHKLLPDIMRDFKPESFQRAEAKIMCLMKAEVSEYKDEVSVVKRMDSRPNQHDCVAESIVNARRNQWKNTLASIQNNNGQKAELQWQEGRLLMSAFCGETINSEPVFKVPKQVFLELSIKDTILGLVIIQPWYHLRRAQHFAFLCLGSFGISYVGSPFLKILNKDKPREYLSGGWYLSPRDGSPCCKDQMTELEWGGEASGEVHAGVVMGACEEGANAFTGTSGFGICIRGEKGGIFKCPFGNVVAGLDVVKRAIQHGCAKDVVITRCGGIVTNPAE